MYDFRKLHQQGNPFVLVNVWDVGSARLMEQLGAKAIATSSAALAYTIGKQDGTLTRKESIDHAATIAQAVNIPVSADLENGYGDSVSEIAETVHAAIEAGLAGISIEDTILPNNNAYSFDLAVKRIEAAMSTASNERKKRSKDFVIVARADGVMTGSYDTAEAKRRLLAFEQVGADCLYAPLLSFKDLSALCQEATAPVNALIEGENTALKVSDFAAIGVARLSLGSSLARATHRLIYNAGQAMLSADGSFNLLQNDTSNSMIDDLIAPKSVY